MVVGMEDITLTRDSELMLAHVQAHTDDGTDFVDAWMPDDANGEYVVVDSGRIIIDEDSIAPFVEAATRHQLILVKNG